MTAELVTTGDIDVEAPYLDARIFNARAESASYVADTLSSARRSVVFLAMYTLLFAKSAYLLTATHYVTVGLRH